MANDFGAAAHREAQQEMIGEIKAQTAYIEGFKAGKREGEAEQWEKTKPLLRGLLNHLRMHVFQKFALTTELAQHAPNHRYVDPTTFKTTVTDDEKLNGMLASVGITNISNGDVLAASQQMKMMGLTQDKIVEQHNAAIDSNFPCPLYQWAADQFDVRMEKKMRWEYQMPAGAYWKNLFTLGNGGTVPDGLGDSESERARNLEHDIPIVLGRFGGAHIISLLNKLADPPENIESWVQDQVDFCFDQWLKTRLNQPELELAT